MPGWLAHVLGNLSAVEAVLSFLGSIVVAMVPIYLRIRSELRKKEAAMRSVPPTACVQAAPAPPALPDTRTSEVDAEQAHVALRRAQWRIKDLELDLSRVGEDHGRTAWALRAATVECARLWALVGELEDRLRKAESAARVAIDNKPTPKQGMIRAKEEE